MTVQRPLARVLSRNGWLRAATPGRSSDGRGRRSRLKGNSAVALTATLCLFTAACTAKRMTRTLTSPMEMQTLDRRSAYLKVHARDGEVYVLSDWRVDEAAREISGRGQRMNVARDTVEEGLFTVPIDAVALVETNVLQRSPTIAALSVITGISAAMTAFCIAQPKACFGSCPTFYVDTGNGRTLEAEGFSSSVAPSLEARDVDALYQARPVGAAFTVTMKNEALETHVVRRVRLLVAPRPPEGRVLATPDGRYREATEIRPLDGCVAPEGDCLARVQALDGQERFTETDGSDLARREVIELRLPPGSPGPHGLLIASRQSLASTYLFYQSLAYLGRSAGATLAALERGDPTVGNALGRLQRALGGIEISAETADGSWIPAGEVHEMGPLASDLVAVPLPAAATGRLRLRLAKGHWRIDYLASVRLGSHVEPRAIDPSSLTDDGGRPVGTQSLTTLPGDTYSYSFALPQDGPVYELFLESQGYYLEWMREEWLAEENSFRAAQLVLDPAQLLRDIAPEFKRQEAQMESVFWGSRYARP